jgi:uncharacterized protein (TIGR00156 family)
MMKLVVAALAALAMTTPATAQFTGPSVTGNAVTVAELRTSLPGRYVSVSGHIVAHQRGDFYTFRDASGEIRVEIEPAVWRGRPVGPDTRVRLLAEVDMGLTGRYLWVKSLELIE